MTFEINASKCKAKKTSNGLKGVSCCSYRFYRLSSELFGADGLGAVLFLCFFLSTPFTNPFRSPPSQLGTGEVKIRKQIGLLANLPGEWEEEFRGRWKEAMRTQREGEGGGIWGGRWIVDVCSYKDACAYLYSYAPNFCICVLRTCHMGSDVSPAAALSYHLFLSRYWNNHTDKHRCFM